MTVKNGDRRTDTFELPVVRGGFGTAVIALAIGLPIFNKEIERLQREKAA